MPEGDRGGRPRLSRGEQRYNYGLAIGAVAVVVLLIVVSPTIVYDQQRVPVLVVALLVGAFLFGLGQMVIGLNRRREYLRTLPSAGERGAAGDEDGRGQGSV